MKVSTWVGDLVVIERNHGFGFETEENQRVPKLVWFDHYDLGYPITPVTLVWMATIVASGFSTHLPLAQV